MFAMTRLCIELAQLGRSHEAREVMGSLRDGSGALISQLVGIYLVLIDGLCHYYDGLKTQSLDRLMRAHALACASQDRRLIGESGVWLSLASYSFEKHQTLERSLVDAAECADALESSVLARLCAILADLLQLAGSMNEAATWYSHARRFARLDQDDAVLVAIEFNRLAAGLSRLKYEEFLGLKLTTLESRQWGIEIASIESLHRAYQSDSLSHLLILCNARNRYFEGNLRETISMLDGLYRDGRWVEVGLTREALLAECTWCKVLAGDLQLISEADFPTIDEILRLDSSTKIDCLFYASEIGGRLFSDLQLMQIRKMLDEARAGLLSQIEVFRSLTSKIVQLDGLKSLRRINA